jgi:nucleotide-binding universal stress UspA family protein
MGAESMSWLPKKCVVVPFDFSEQSAKALEAACEIVEDAAHLHVIHVLPKLTVAEPGVVWTSTDDEARIRHAEKAFREGFAASPFCKGDFHVRIGDPGSEIAKFAEQLQADLIVIPSHGRSGIPRVLIGSVAERVLRLAHCPVLVLRGLSRTHA